VDSRIYIFAGGGTGGHLYPGLAVAEELKRLDGEARVIFACSNRSIDRRILGPTSYAAVPQPVRPLPRGLRGWGRFAWAWSSASAQARDIIADLLPVAVLGLGGFAAGPLVCRAARAGVPAAVLNPDAVPGKANRYLARHAEVIFTQFASTRECFPPPARRKVRCVGCPVRRGLLTAKRDGASRWFNLDAARKTLLVFGASLGAASINDAARRLAGGLDEFAETWQLLHITGSEKCAEFTEAYKGCRIVASVLEYCDRMDLAYAAADLVVCRAGASTVAELAATGTPAVLIPYPHHSDLHQRLNAAALAEAGAAVIVDDRLAPAANAAALQAALVELLGDSARLEAMRLAAKALARPQAAQEVAEWLAER